MSMYEPFSMLDVSGMTTDIMGVISRGKASDKQDALIADQQRQNKVAEDRKTAEFAHWQTQLAEKRAAERQIQQAALENLNVSVMRPLSDYTERKKWGDVISLNEHVVNTYSTSKAVADMNNARAHGDAELVSQISKVVAGQNQMNKLVPQIKQVMSTTSKWMNDPLIDGADVWTHRAGDFDSQKDGKKTGAKTQFSLTEIMNSARAGNDEDSKAARRWIIANTDQESKASNASKFGWQYIEDPLFFDQAQVMLTDSPEHRRYAARSLAVEKDSILRNVSREDAKSRVDRNDEKFNEWLKIHPDGNRQVFDSNAAQRDPILRAEQAVSTALTADNKISQEMLGAVYGDTILQVMSEQGQKITPEIITKAYGDGGLDIPQHENDVARRKVILDVMVGGVPMPEEYVSAVNFDPGSVASIRDALHNKLQDPTVSKEQYNQIEVYLAKLGDPKYNWLNVSPYNMSSGGESVSKEERQHRRKGIDVFARAESLKSLIDGGYNADVMRMLGGVDITTLSDVSSLYPELKEINARLEKSQPAVALTERTESVGSEQRRVKAANELIEAQNKAKTNSLKASVDLTKTMMSLGNDVDNPGGVSFTSVNLQEPVSMSSGNVSKPPSSWTSSRKIDGWFPLTDESGTMWVDSAEHLQHVQKYMAQGE